MATAGAQTPFMASVTATTTPQTLLALMRTVWSDFKDHACFIQLQLDISAAGTTVAIGNANVSSVMRGASLSAGQINQTFVADTNCLIPGQIYLLASTGTALVNVIVVTK